MLVEREKLVRAAERRYRRREGSACDAVGEARHAGGADWGRPAEAGSSDRTGGAEHAHKSSKTGYSSSKIAQLEQDRVQFEKDRTQIEQSRMQVTECEAKQEALEERELQLESQAAELAEQVTAASCPHDGAGGASRAVGRGASVARRAQPEFATAARRAKCRALELETKAADLDTLRDDLNAQVAELRQATERNEAASDQGGESPEASGVEPARERLRKGQDPSRSWSRRPGNRPNLCKTKAEIVSSTTRCRWRGARTTQTKRRM